MYICEKRKEPENMSDKKLEVIKNLQQAEAVYVIMSGFTKMPYVVCDEVTFDDKVFIYFEEEHAKEAGKRLLEAGNLVHIAKVEKRQFLEFYTSLYPIGVNCLHINQGVDGEIQIQQSDLLRRKEPEDMDDGKVRVENPEFQLTALYFAQEFRKNQTMPMSDELREIYEEMLAHFGRGQYIVPTQEEHGIPILKQKEGQAYLPLFTDLQEFQKFNREGKFKGGVVEAEKVSNLLHEEMSGVVVNPFGVNLLLNMEKKNA